MEGAYRYLEYICNIKGTKQRRLSFETNTFDRICSSSVPVGFQQFCQALLTLRVSFDELYLKSMKLTSYYFFIFFNEIG